MKMPELKIGNLVAKIPIIQGGMGVGVSLSKLAASVANQGGIGVISSVALGMLYPEKGNNFREANQNALRDEIRKAKKLSNGIIGLNIMIAVSDFDELSKIAIEENVDILFMGAGLPIKLPKNVTLEEFVDCHTKAGVIVSSARATKIIFKTWSKKFKHIPDIVVIEGPKAGGHLGFSVEQLEDENYQLEKIFPEVQKIVKKFADEYNKEIPIVVAGGIFDGKDICKMIKLGANGVQMGTRFVATDECEADQSFKEAYINCKKEDVEIIKSPVGLPGRAITNNFLRSVKAGTGKPFKCMWKCLKTCDYRTAPYCIADALTNAQKGMLEDGFAFAGTNAYLVDKIVSVKELFSILIDEYNQACTEV